MKKTKKIDTFTIILASIILFITFFSFLSIPVLFNYKSVETQIEKKFYKEFNINLEILDKISHKSFPSPHLLIKKANLILHNNSTMKVQAEDIKIFIPLKNIYSKNNIIMDSVEIKNVNFKFDLQSIKDIRNHLYYKINKPIKIKKSKFFYIDKNKKTILIAPIKKINYYIDTKNRFKELKIKGNIFDIDYESEWRRYYDNPKETVNEIKLKNPNLLIKNLFKFENNLNFSGKSSLSFLNETIYVNYNKNKDQIYISYPKEYNNQKIKITSNIELNPFYFNTEINLFELDFEFIIDHFLIYLNNVDKDILGNLNGSLILNINDLNDQLINNGKINLLINEKSLNVLDSVFEINNVGYIKSKFKYYEKEGDLIFTTNNVLHITNKDKFAKKFQLKLDKVKNIDKIYFDLEKNIDNKKIFISNIQLNKKIQMNESNESYEINSIQTLKSLLKNIII